MARRRNAEESKEQITEAATALFAERGFASTMREIAERAGVTKGLIHHHFGSKDELWESVKEHLLERFAQAQYEVMARAEATGSEFMRSLLRGYFAFLRDNPKLARIMCWVYARRKRLFGTTDKGTNVYTLVADMLRSTRRDSDDAPFAEHSEIPAEIFLQMVVAVAEHWYMTEGWVFLCEQYDYTHEEAEAAYLGAIDRVFLDRL